MLPACKRSGKQDGALSGEEIVLQVGDRAITLREFFEDFDRAKLERGISGDPQAALAMKNTLLAETLKRELILRRAREKGLSVSAEEVSAEIAKIKTHYPGEAFREMLAEQYVAYDEWIERQKVRLLVEKVVTEELENKITVSEAEARAWFDAHPEIAAEPERVRVLQILVSHEEEAKLLRARIVRGGDDFSAMARERSISPEAPSGGDLGMLSVNEVPDMMKVAFTLQPGAVSEVVQSEFGFHVFKVTEKVAGRTMSWEEVRTRATEQAKNAKVEQAFPAWLEQLAAGVKVYRNDAMLAAIE